MIAKAAPTDTELDGSPGVSVDVHADPDTRMDAGSGQFLGRWVALGKPHGVNVNLFFTNDEDGITTIDALVERLQHVRTEILSSLGEAAQEYRQREP